MRADLLQKSNSRAPVCPARAGSLQRLAVRIQLQLFADLFVADPRANVILQAVRKGDEEVVHALLLDDLRKEPPRLSRVVLSQELADLLDRDFSLEVQVQIVEQIADEFLHARPPSLPVQRPAVAHRYTHRSNSGASRLDPAHPILLPSAR